MDQYDRVATQAARLVTDGYSSSFGMATKLFPKHMRGDIYNIYGLVRIADEIVDSYQGNDAAEQLVTLEAEVYAAIKRGFSSNIIVHAFNLTARKHDIGKDIIAPFFYSMKLDTKPQKYNQKLYERYIVGSAEVVGLMCLKVFVASAAEYLHLEPGARALGAAFQKVNFLRDLAEDNQQLSRYYFPIGSYDTFDKDTKQSIVAEIEEDFAVAKSAIVQLPREVRAPVIAATLYYEKLLKKLKETPAETIKIKRVRVPDSVKLALLARTAAISRVTR